MNEDEATRMLANLGERVPVGPAPIDVTLQQGKGNSARRRAIQVVSGVAAVAVIAVGAFIVQPSIGGSGNLTTQPTTSPSELAVPQGTRLVGMNGVAVAVPDDWSTNDTKCGQALSDTVDFNDSTAMTDCLIHGSEEFSLLRAAPLTSEWGRVSAAFNNGQTVDLQGIPAERLPTRCEDSQSNTAVTCHGTLVVSSLNAVINLTSPNREVVDAVLDSASSIPEGYTAVPDLTGLYSDSDVEPLVESAGLLWENRCPDGSCSMPLIEVTDPAVGSVVPLGTTVRVAHRPDQGQASVPPSIPAGVPVQALTERDLLGQWRAVGELEQQLESAAFSGRSMALSFSQSHERFEWGGADGCSSLAGRFEVSANGEFSTSHVTQTDMGCPSVERDVVTVPDVVIRASQVRLVDGDLRLYEEDSLLGTFERLEATATPTTPPTTPPNVPTEKDLLGQWRAVGELEQQLENAGFPDKNMVLVFSQSDGKFSWGGINSCNGSAGRFEVAPDGAFAAPLTMSTAMGCPPFAGVTVPEVVVEASQVRLVSNQLRLFDEDDSLLATFERLEATSRPTTPPTSPPQKSNQNGPREGTQIPLSTSSWKPGDPALAGGIEGRIQLSKDGCVYLQGLGGVKSDVIWPAGYSADVSADGVLTVRNPAGEPVGHEGTKIYVAGGGASENEGGIPDGLLSLLECQVSDSVLYINDELPPL